MTDNNQVGSRLPQWMPIERIFDNRLRSTNSTERDAQKDAEVISLSPLWSKNPEIKKTTTGGFQSGNSLSQFKGKEVFVKRPQLGVYKRVTADHVVKPRAKNYQRGVFFFLAHKWEQPNAIIIKWNDWYTQCQSLSGVARTTLRVSNWEKLWERILHAEFRLTAASKPSGGLA